VIVGSSAGALIGLQFVVLTLVAENPLPRSASLGSTFGTPTIIHFSAVLLLSAIVSAPWRGIVAVAVVLGLVGLSGITYSVIVARRLRTQNEYKPVFEDWLFNVLLPFAAYVTLTVSAFAAPSRVHEAFFGIGAAALLLLFVGIHNAWDGVAYHLFTKKS
jgi:hypothetical protein